MRYELHVRCKTNNQYGFSNIPEKMTVSNDDAKEYKMEIICPDFETGKAKALSVCDCLLNSIYGEGKDMEKAKDMLLAFKKGMTEADDTDAPPYVISSFKHEHDTDKGSAFFGSLKNVWNLSFKLNDDEYVKMRRKYPFRQDVMEALEGFQPLPYSAEALKGVDKHIAEELNLQSL